MRAALEGEEMMIKEVIAVAVRKSIHIHTFLHTCMHACMHAYMVYKHASIHTYIYGAETLCVHVRAYILFLSGVYMYV